MEFRNKVVIVTCSGKGIDIAEACIWLTKDGNEFINGAYIIIDGGMTRKMIYEP